jgi:Domain of unknown function (DUF4397)
MVSWVLTGGPALHVRGETMSVISRIVVALTTGLLLTGAGTSAYAGVDSVGRSGRLVIVQAVPRDALDITVDGHSLGTDSAVGAILGPVTVTAGRHRVAFTDASGNLRLTSTVDVAPGSSSDIVVHLPAQVGGKPVINAYRTPRSPIAPGKARVLIAHTATVAPADVRVDGKVVFHDIANGEYATADLAAGAHTVALLPAGLTTTPILGPLHVDLKAGTVTMVYAVGNPRDKSMNVISHTAVLSSNGAVVPESIDTGSAGLAAPVVVHPFRVVRHGAVTTTRTSDSWGLSSVVALVVLVAALAVAGLRSNLLGPPRPRRRRQIRPG